MARKKTESAPEALVVSAPTLTVGTELLRTDPPALASIKAIDGEHVTLTIADDGDDVVVPLSAIDIAAGTWADPTPPEAGEAKAPEALVVSAPAPAPPVVEHGFCVSALLGRPSASANPLPLAAAPPGPVIPTTHELATWTGLGRFAGMFFSFPDGKERSFCVGKTLGYFPKASIAKLKDHFQRHAPADDGKSEPVLTAPVESEGAPEDHVLAQWTGLGRYGGAFYTFPARELRSHCVGPTLGYFPAASVKKLTKHFAKP